MNKRGQINPSSLFLTVIVVAVVLGSLVQINIQVQKSEQILAAPLAPTPTLYTFDAKNPGSIITSQAGSESANADTWLKYLWAVYHDRRLAGKKFTDATEITNEFLPFVLGVVYKEYPNKYKQLIASPSYKQLVNEIYANAEAYIPLHNTVANFVRLDPNGFIINNEAVIEREGQIKNNGALRDAEIKSPKTYTAPFTDSQLKKLCLMGFDVASNLDRVSGCETFNFNINDPGSVLKDTSLLANTAPGADTWLKYLNKAYSRDISNNREINEEKVINEMLQEILEAISGEELSKYKSFVESPAYKQLGNELYTAAQIYVPLHNRAVSMLSVEQRDQYLKNLEKFESNTKIEAKPILDSKLIEICIDGLRVMKSLKYKSMCGDLAEAKKTESSQTTIKTSAKQPKTSSKEGIQICHPNNALFDVKKTSDTVIDTSVKTFMIGLSEHVRSDSKCSVYSSEALQKTGTTIKECTSVQTGKIMAPIIKPIEQDSGTCLELTILEINNYPDIKNIASPSLSNFFLSWVNGRERVVITNNYIGQYTERIALKYKNGLISSVVLSDSSNKAEREISFSDLVYPAGQTIRQTAAIDILNEFKFDESGYDYAFFYSYLKLIKIDVVKIGLPNPDDLKILVLGSAISKSKFDESVGNVVTVRGYNLPTPR